jgi:hypothetical protein
VEIFLRMSETLTGFKSVDLLATGMVRPYYDELTRVIGAREVGAFLSAGLAVYESKVTTEHDLDSAFRAQLLDNERFGPVARNVINMWYLGSWKQLPREWRNSYGAMAADFDRVISPEAYREGLAWVAAGTHPMGAKQPGFGSWSSPPPD